MMLNRGVHGSHAAIIVHGRTIMIHCLVARILVHKRGWGVTLLLLLLLLLLMWMLLLWMAERIVVVELRRHMMAERRHVHHRGCMECISRRREGEGRPEAHADSYAHPWCMEVASLVVV